MTAAIHLALGVPVIRDLIVAAAALFVLGLWPGPFRFTMRLLEPTDADALAVKMPRIASTPLLPRLEWDEESEASAPRAASQLERLLSRCSSALPRTMVRRPV